MFAKVSTGSGFSAAAAYNEEGISEEQKAQKVGKVEFLGSYNLMSDQASLIAREMIAVASASRSTEPCWNVSLSAAPGQFLNKTEWQQAADQYLRGIGADPDRHQVAIWRHNDTKHDHIHILINAVPVDGGPALGRYRNHYQAKRIAKEIDKNLGQPIIKAPGIRELIADSLKTVLHDHKSTTLEELTKKLRELGITPKIASRSGVTYGISFQKGDSEPIKGSDIGFKWPKINTILKMNLVSVEPPKVPQIDEKKPVSVKQHIERILKTSLSDAQIDALKAGKRLTISQIGRIVWIEDQILKQAPIEKKTEMPLVANKALPGPVSPKSAESTPEPKKVQEIEQKPPKIANPPVTLKTTQTIPSSSKATSPDDPITAAEAPKLNQEAEAVHVAPPWHSALRELLKTKRKTPALGMAGYSYSKVKNQKGGTVDLEIWQTKGKKENAVKLSEFAPDAGMMRLIKQGMKM